MNDFCLAEWLRAQLYCARRNISTTYRHAGESFRGRFADSDFAKEVEAERETISANLRYQIIPPTNKLTEMTMGPDITTDAFLRPSDGQEGVECRRFAGATFKKESEIERKSANPRNLDPIFLTTTQ